MQPQGIEKVPAHPEPVHVVYGSALRQVEAIAAPSECTGKNVLPVANLFPERIGKLRIAYPAGVRIDHAYQPQFLRPLHRQHPQRDGIDEAEDGRVGADSNGQRENRHRRKPGVLGQHPQGEPDVLKQRVDEAHTPRVTAFFLDLFDAAEFAQRGVASFFHTHPCGKVLLSLFRDVERQLVRQLLVEFVFSEERAQTAE